MKNKAVLLISYILIPLAALCQKNSKVVADAVTKQPLDYVYIRSDTKNITLLSNKEGRFIIVNDETVRAFSFYKIGYQSRSIAAAELLKMDTVFLTESFIELQTVDITVKVIDTLVKNKRFYVDDYLILPNNDFLLLSSKINIPGFDVMYFKRGKGITCIKKIKEELNNHFFTDCFKNIHVLTDNYSRQIFFDSDTSFDFLPKYNRIKFDSTLANCVIKMDSAILVKFSLPSVMIKGGFMQNPPFMSYLILSRQQRRIFHTVYYSKEIMEMLSTEIADGEMIRRNSIELGGRPPSPESIANFHALFYNKIAAPIYAPAFLKNDTVVIFNFQENKIVFLNRKGEILAQTNLDEKGYNSMRDFEIIYDEPKQVFYIKTKKLDKSCLQRVNIYSGKVSPEIKLEKIFAKKIRVKNGKIYYLVKEKGWDDTCYLYQQN